MGVVKYCDYINGNDTTGDGSYGNPYKTIDKGTTGLTGGDEVRCAKSPDPTALTGTIAFTENSTTITGTNTLFTTELVIGDYIEGGDGNWYEVITITNNTSATLYQRYYSPSQSGVSSRKLGVTSTGAAASQTGNVQNILSAGTSVSSRLKISGGWDLATQTQTGWTYFRQMHGTFANRYGYGLYASSKYFFEIEKLGFLRYYRGFSASTHGSKMNFLCSGNSDYGYNFNGGYGNTYDNCVTSHNGSSGFYYASGSFNDIINNLKSSGPSGSTGLYMYNVYHSTINSPVCKYNYIGIRVQSCLNVKIVSPNCSRSGLNGIQFTNSALCTVTSPTCDNCNSGIYTGYSIGNTVTNFLSTTNITFDTDNNHPEEPALMMERFGGVSGDNRCYYTDGITYRDTVNARSGECLKFDPSNATYYISQSFFFKADSGVAQMLTAYIKKESAFNGDVQGAIYFLDEPITDWTDITPSVNDEYQQQSLMALAEDIIEDGVLELKIRVRGTTGNVYVDDLATT